MGCIGQEHCSLRPEPLHQRRCGDSSLRPNSGQGGCRGSMPVRYLCDGRKDLLVGGHAGSSHGLRLLVAGL
jgi:hypothetical protein